MKLVENWIVLTLTNVNASASSTVTLFKTVNSSSVSGGELVSGLPAIDLPAIYQITYSIGDGPTTGVLTPIVNTIEELVDEILNILSGQDSQCYFTESPAGFYNIYFFSTYYVLASIRVNSIPYPAISLNQTVISGSTINVDVESDITYDELCSELQSQPYILDWVSVFAPNITQANQQFVINDRETSGTTDGRIKNPKILPTQKQFVNLKVPINFRPSSTHQLSYTVDAGQSVRLIFGYRHTKLLTIPEKSIIVEKKLLPELEIILIKHQIDDVPLIAVVKPHIYKPNGNFLKKIIRPFIQKDRIIDKNEVFSAFNGTDFKEF